MSAKKQKKQQPEGGHLWRATTRPELQSELVAKSEHLLCKNSDGTIVCTTHNNRPAEECLPRSTSALVWQETLDNGTFTCDVVRLAPYRGLLTLRRGMVVVFTQEVHLAYDAPFGADGEDIYTWREICIQHADADYRKRGLTPPC